jgi:hypothetical protein
MYLLWAEHIRSTRYKKHELTASVLEFTRQPKGTQLQHSDTTYTISMNSTKKPETSDTKPYRAPILWPMIRFSLTHPARQGGSCEICMPFALPDQLQRVDSLMCAPSQPQHLGQSDQPEGLRSLARASLTHARTHTRNNEPYTPRRRYIGPIPIYPIPIIYLPVF